MRRVGVDRKKKEEPDANAATHKFEGRKRKKGGVGQMRKETKKETAILSRPGVIEAIQVILGGRGKNGGTITSPLSWEKEEEGNHHLMERE